MTEHPWFGPDAARLELEVRKQAKAELRTRLRRQRGALPSKVRDTRSAKIVASLLTLPEWSTASLVASFEPMGKEVDVRALRRAAHESGKSIALPRVDRATDALRFFVVGPDARLETSPFGVAEPPEDANEVSPDALELVIVPGLAFDERGFRLGYGKGYYDRFLAPLRCPTVGVAYDFELMAELPEMAWDVPVTALVTDARVHRVRPV